MSNKPNLYFFRDIEGYEVEEIESRLFIEDLRNKPEAVKDIIAEAGLESSVLDKEKHEILRQIKTNIDNNKYERFLKDLFDDTGEKGDKANLQIYKLPNVSRRELLEKLSSENDSERDYLLEKVNNYRASDDGYVDIQFEVADTGGYLSQEDVELLGDNNSESVKFDDFISKLDEEGILDELDIDDVNALRENKDLEVEARLYPNSGLLFVSNREIWDQLQTDIRDHICEWSGSSEPTGNLQLRENELLYFQNVMGGNNSGLDYSDFIDKRLNTAKYRGPKQESLTLSRVLQPAQNEGKITQVRFYYEYESWITQVRIHDDAHFTTSKPTKADFVDSIENHLSTILEYRNYLKSIDGSINEFASEKQRVETHFNERNYRKTRKTAFSKLVGNYILDESYSESEKQLYASIIANICIGLGQLDLDTGSYPDPDDIDRDELPDSYRELKTFIDDYFSLKMNIAPPDFEALIGHLNYVFAELFVQPDESPIDLVDAVDDKYDIRT